ncbi:MAG: SDR family oxidoreductase [Desulfarculaceae bacterium]
MPSVQELMDLSGRVALVTGGAGHLGRAICAALAELGAALAVLDMQAQPCTEVAEDISQQYHVSTLALACDLNDEKALRETPAKVIDNLGGLHILVNCAAFVGTSSLKGWAVPFDQQQPESWRAALEVNLTAPFLLTQACAPALTASKQGSVINISSIYGMVGPDMSLYDGTAMGNPAAYAASKGGLLQLTRWLATVLAPKVRVNAISLGGIARNQPPEFVERYQKRTPLGRLATEDEIKGAAAFLASDLSSYVTGANLVVDGGWTAW